MARRVGGSKLFSTSIDTHGVIWHANQGGEAMPDEWLFWDDARMLLGISRDKMTKLVRAGVLESKPDPLDARRLLVKKSSVEALKAQSASRTRKQEA